jgi:hypothetical protein
MKAGRDEEWLRAWKALDPARRKAIKRKMARGEAIQQREDAALALRGAAQIERVRGALRPVTWIFGGLLFAILVIEALTGPRLFALLVAAGFLCNAALSLFAWHRRRQMHRFVRETRRVGGGGLR